MTTDLTALFNAFIALCAALVTVFVIPWVKTKMSAQSAENLLTWVSVAVKAAEQLYTSEDGQKKKAYVVQFLKDKGYTVDTEEVENAVEAAVLELHTDLYGVSE